MNEFLKVLEAAIPVFIIIGTGAALRRINWLTRESDESLLRVGINLLFPCLILDATLGNTALNKWQNLVMAPAVGFGTVCLGILLAALCARLAGMKGNRERGTFAVTVGIYNYAYVPLPLALMLFDKQVAGVLFVHNMGVELAMWTVGVLMLGGGGKRDWRKLLNAPLIAICCAVLLNLSGISSHVPEVVRATFHWLGQCAIPIALLLIGAVVADRYHEFHGSPGWGVIFGAIGLRIVLLPMLFLLLAWCLPMTSELKRVVILQAAMPSAVFPIVMAQVYGGDTATALRVVIGTSVVGLVTIPLWIQFGMRVVGL